MYDEKSNDLRESIQKWKRPVKDPQVLCSLLDLKEWLYVTEINMVENELDYKNVFFLVQGCSYITSSILNHQGVGYKITTGWHNHQGVSETPKMYDIIYEQPLSNFNKEIRALWNFTKVHLQLYWPHTDWPHGALGILLWQGAGKQLTLAAA